MALDYLGGFLGITQAERMQMEILTADERARLSRFKEAWEAYFGRYPAPLKIKAGQPDDTVLVNKVRVIVDKGVSFLFGQDVEFQLDETTTTPEEEHLEQVWVQNRKITTLQKLAVNGGVCGQAFVKIQPRQPPLVPRLIVLDPSNVTPSWDPEDLEHVWRYRIQWNAIDRDSGKPVVRRQIIEEQARSWSITDEVSRAGGRWDRLSETLWPHPWPPIVECQNLPSPNEYWGQADVEADVLALVRSRNFTLSNISRILKYHAHPKTWGKGVGASTIDTSVDAMILLQNEKAELHNLEMQSDLASSLEFDRRIDEGIHEISRVPAIATGKLETIGDLSGVALAILYQPLLEKTETKRGTYGELLTELNRRLLALGGFGEELRPKNVWPELLPRDPKAEREALLLDDQLGVASKETIAGKLGYDWETEQERIEQERQNMGDQMLTQFERGTAMGADDGRFGGGAARGQQGNGGAGNG